MEKLLYFTSGHADPGLGRLVAAGSAEIVAVDLYHFDELALDRHAAHLVSMHVDQRHLAARTDRLDAYLREGGTVVANGHHAYPFLRGLSPFRPILKARRDAGSRVFTPGKCFGAMF